MKGVISSLAFGVCLLALSFGVAFADNLHKLSGTTGQTGSNVLADCGEPGSLGFMAKTNSGGGSPFNPDVTKTYAGSGVGNPNNPKAVSQYDNACAQAQLH